MENGFIYPLINIIINIFYFFNPVELWKKAYKLLRPKEDLSDKVIFNEAIDIFIVAKFIFIFIIYYFDKYSLFLAGLVIYLIIFNLFTYFYYHVWKNKGDTTLERDRRRFINLILSIIYSNISFGYLYKNFIENFCLDDKIISINLETIYISFMTIFGGTLTPKDELGLKLIFFNVVVNLFFIVIVLSNTNIEEIKSKQQK